MSEQAYRWIPNYDKWARITRDGKYHHHYFNTGWYTDCGLRFHVRPIHYTNRTLIEADDICKRCEESPFAH